MTLKFTMSVFLLNYFLMELPADQSLLNPRVCVVSFYIVGYMFFPPYLAGLALTLFQSVNLGTHFFIKFGCYTFMSLMQNAV